VVEGGTYISREYLIIIFILIGLRVCRTQGTAPLVLLRPLLLINRLRLRILGRRLLCLFLFGRRFRGLVNLQGLEGLDC
jgi:hypothetical protein